MAGLDAEGDTTTIHDVLVKSAQSSLDLQRDDGSFPPGRNYTYDEPETPVRTTSHWAVTLSEAYDITGEARFEEAANAAIDYLLSDEVRPHGYTFHCRNTEEKDLCNGVVGQGSAIRALGHAGGILDREDAIATGIEVFELHPFDEDLGLWEKVEIDGEKLSFDRTLNHQILFAAASSKLASESDIVSTRIKAFLGNLDSNIQLHSNGLIKHYIRPQPTESLRAFRRETRHWRLLLNEVMYHYYSRSNEQKSREIGYQPVNLRGMAMIKSEFPDHHFWSTKLMDSAVNRLQVDESRRSSQGSIIPGINAAWVCWVFNNCAEGTSKYISEELNINSSFNPYMADSCDNAGRDCVISLVAGLPDIELRISGS